jgi:hypothetical protein
MVTKLFAATAILACTALSACGGGGGKSSTAASTPATSSTTSTTASTTTDTTTSTATTTTAATPAGSTPPGTNLKLGETAHVTLKPLSSGFDSKLRYKIDATVLSIEKGKKADFNNINLDAKQKASAAYYVRVKLANSSTKPIPVKDDPDVRFDGVDDRGQDQNNVIFIGGFDACDDKTAPKPFSKGKSYESCLVYLIPGGGSIKEVHWSGADEYYSKPVVWK